MLVIRKEQLDVFSRQSRSRFEEDIVNHFLTTYSRETRQAGGETQVRQVVLDGIERAAVFGFVTEKQVTLFVSLLFMLGCDFDTDPQIPWARDIGSKSIKNPELRINLVFNTAVEYLTATAGQDCEHVVRALLRIRAYKLDQAPQSIGEQFVRDTLAILRQFSPEKFDHQGEEVTRRLVVAARRTANRYGITRNRGVLLLAALMFMLGSGIDHDPLHPWVSKSLTDPKVPDEEARTDALYREAMTHITLSLQAD